MIARRRLLATALSAPALAPPATAQPAPLRIGWLTAQREASLATFIPALRTGLAERNLAEGRDLDIVFRFGNDDLARVPHLMGELLRAQVKMLMVQGAAVATVVRARPPVPLVFVMSSDPVAAGIAESLSRPPPGVTGITFLSAGLNAKRVELLRELRPDLSRLAVLRYGPRLEESYRRLAHFVARILRGARPEEMPIEQPRIFELVVNQRTAAALGLAIPTNLLARADLVLE